MAKTVKKETGMALVPVKNNGGGIPDIYRAGKNEYKDVPLGFPIYRLDQKSGKWVDVLDKTEQEVVRAVLLYSQKTRKHYNPDVKADPVWLCRSLDTKHGEPHPSLDDKARAAVLKATCNGNCAKCRLKEWKNNDPPACSDVWMTLMKDLQQGQIFVINFKKTGVKHIMNTLKSLRAKGVMSFAIPMKIGSTLEKKDKFKWYEPEINLEDSYLPVEDFQILLADIDNLREQFAAKKKEIAETDDAIEEEMETIEQAKA